MTCPDFVREALSQFAKCFDTGESIAVPTQCLYPSNGSVTVFITGGPRSCVVSDGGRSITEINAHGIEVRDPERYLRQFCAPRGLKLEGSRIHSPPITAEALPTAISLVASASGLAAHWGIYNLKSRVRRDLRKELRDLLGLRYAEDRIVENGKLEGSSGRPYKFEFVVEIGNEQQLVVDGVSPEPASINAHAIAHLDLARVDGPKRIQRLVYDDAEDWSAAEINLLSMAAQLVPISRFAQNVDALALMARH